MADGEIVLTEDKYRFIEKMGLFYETFGMPRIGGRIVGLALIVDRPVSAEQMSRLLKVSRSSVSTNLRLLLSFGFLAKVSIPGDRSDYYVVSESAWGNTIKMRIEAYRNLQGIVEQGIDSFGPGGSGSEKLQEMLRWVTMLAGSHEELLREWKERAGRSS